MTGTASPLIITGLSNGTPYTFSVTATNSAGTGAAATSNTVTPLTVPGAPTISTVTPGNGRATINFSAPASNGGTAITGYTVSSNPPDGVDATPIPTTLTHVLLGLINGTSYTFTVNASNSVGTGSESPPSNAVIPATIPGAPTGLSAVPGIASATVSFTAPASNGGAAITGYTVTATPGGVTATGIASPIQLTGLTSGTSYTFTVKATNAVGSAVSAPSNVVIPLQTLTVLGPVITGGFGHSVALKPDGTLWVWGQNFYGQLGDGTTHDLSVPKAIGGGYAAVAAGDNHTLALTADGRLWSWGVNSNGQLGDGTQNISLKPEQIGSGYKLVAAGSLHSLAIDVNGNLYAWGANNFGQLGNQNTSATPVTNPVFIGAGFSQVSAGISHTLGLKANGDLYAWGNNDHGQLGDGTTTARNAPGIPIDHHYLAISAAGSHSIGLKTDGTLWSWGSNSNGELGNNSTTDLKIPTQITPGTLYKAIAAGYNHNLALDTNNNLWTWGANDKGQLGNGSTTGSWFPIQIGTGYSSITAGTGYTVALKNDGSVWAMGNNWYGQLGDGTLAQRPSAALVVNDSVSGPLDLIPTATKNITADQLPPYWLEVTKAANVSAAITYNNADLNQSGNVYVVAYLDPNSPLLTGTALPAGMKHASTITRAGTTLVAAVLTRSGWKQAAAGVATVPAFTGVLNSSTSNIAMYDATKFDQTKDTGIFCVAYAAGSAKGLMRSVVTGVGVSATDCPAIQTTATIDTQLPSIPTNLSAIASGNQINLTWTAATDNVAVTTYNVYRNGVITPLAILGKVTNYSDSAVAAGTTYSYTVQACDAAQNCSAQSVAAQATTNKTGQNIGTINFTPNVLPLNGTVTASATGGASGNLVIFTSTTTGICSATGVNGSTITGLSAGACIIAADQAGNGSYAAAPEVTQSITVVSTATLNLLANWNLLGNSVNVPLTVASIFSDTNKVATVWKWIPTTSKWAFYTPSFVDGGQAYATTKGYDFLTTINGGEGYWVNAKTDFSVLVPSGTAVNAIYFQEQLATAQNKLVQGWNLIAIADNLTPGNFNKRLSQTPPAQGVIPLNVTTLWAWDSGLSNWYFYAPSLEISGGLGSYITNKSYLDFTLKGKTLEPTTGFWVNKP